MGGVFLCPTPAKARRAVPEDASTFPRVLPPRPSRVRERFHGDIIVSPSFCAFARDAWTITEMGAGDDPAPGREGEKITRSRAGTGNRAGIERATGVARRTPAPRPPLCVDRVRLPINIRSSSRVNRFESSHRGVAVESTNSPRVPLNSFSSPSPLDARALAVCRLFSRAFRSSRSSVPSASPSVVFPVPRVVLPPLPPPRFPPRLVFESRARSLSRHRDFHSFVWVDEVLGFTSYDSRMYPCANNHEL